MNINTQEALEEALARYGIRGRWVNPDEYGFSRTYNFTIGSKEYSIVWYPNYSILTFYGVRMYIDQICDGKYCTSPGYWIAIKFKGKSVCFLEYTVF